jgi:hypothetical protein
LNSSNNFQLEIRNFSLWLFSEIQQWELNLFMKHYLHEKALNRILLMRYFDKSNLINFSYSVDKSVIDLVVVQKMLKQLK